jgi:hypothetical protein
MRRFNLCLGTLFALGGSSSCNAESSLTYARVRAVGSRAVGKWALCFGASLDRSRGFAWGAVPGTNHSQSGGQGDWRRNRHVDDGS